MRLLFFFSRITAVMKLRRCFIKIWFIFVITLLLNGLWFSSGNSQESSVEIYTRIPSWIISCLGESLRRKKAATSANRSVFVSVSVGHDLEVGWLVGQYPVLHSVGQVVLLCHIKSHITDSTLMYTIRVSASTRRVYSAQYGCHTNDGYDDC